MIRKAAIAGLLVATVWGSGLTGVSAETLSRVQTASNQFGNVYGTVWHQGKLYISDSEGGLIKVLDTAGQQAPLELVKTLKEPKGMAVGPDGALYVAESGRNRIIRVSPQGVITEIAGSETAGFRDGQGKEARFHGPTDVAAAPDGSLYVADTLNHRIRKIDPKGNVTTIAGNSNQQDEEGWLKGGYRDGMATESLLNEPSSIARDAKGNLYIADTGNQRIRLLTSDGQMTTLAGGGEEWVEDRYFKGGFADGKGAEARFSSPMGIVIDKNSRVYVADTWNHAIRHVTEDGTVRTVAGGTGNGLRDGYDQEGLFDGPTDLAVDDKGVVWITDRWNYTVRYVEALPVSNQTNPNQIRIMLGESELPLKDQPVIMNGNTHVPLREIAEKLGYQVNYDAATKAITLRKGDSVTPIDTRHSAVVKQRTMLPIRDLGKQLHLHVEWSPAHRIVTLTPLPE